MLQTAILKKNKQMKKTFTAYALVLMLVIGVTHSYGEENASNPLAAVNNTDVRWQYFDLDGPERNDFWLDGSYMLNPKLCPSGILTV